MTGNVVVTRNGYASNAVPIIIRPTILSLGPDNAAIGEDIVITGGAFNATAANNQVTFPGAGIVVPSSGGQNSLTVTVPVGALSGSITVTDTVAGEISNGAAFIVNP